MGYFDFEDVTAVIVLSEFYDDGCRLWFADIIRGLGLESVNDTSNRGD